MRPATDSPVERLQRKLAGDTAQQARDRYFAVRILPLLLVWALLMAVSKVVVGGLISLGVALTTYFGGAVVLVIWLESRARRHAGEG